MESIKEKVKIGRGKFAGINACADEKGVIAALALDQRHTLKNSIAAARGANGQASDEDLRQFKAAVTKILTPFATALLVDLQYGELALASRAPGTGLLLTYEKTGYDVTNPARMPDLIEDLSVRRLVERGANAIKILLHYNPNGDPQVNAIKQAFVERVGAECQALDIPLFLEPLAFDENIEDGNTQGLAFARKKPEYVTHYMEEFSKPRYGVDVLKVEMPINMKYVAGTRAFKDEGVAYSRAEALQHLRAAASVATKPFIYLSAGVSDEIFLETLEMAAEAGVSYSGVLCGRATWQGGIPVYANQGIEALEQWLQDRGVQNIQALNDVLARGAKSIWTIYGGRENIETV